MMWALWSKRKRKLETDGIVSRHKRKFPREHKTAAPISSRLLRQRRSCRLQKLFYLDPQNLHPKSSKVDAKCVEIQVSSTLNSNYHFLAQDRLLKSRVLCMIYRTVNNLICSIQLPASLVSAPRGDNFTTRIKESEGLSQHNHVERTPEQRSRKNIYSFS